RFDGDTRGFSMGSGKGESKSRILQLLDQSEDLRMIENDWERIWFVEQPSHLTPERRAGRITSQETGVELDTAPGSDRLFRLESEASLRRRIDTERAFITESDFEHVQAGLPDASPRPLFATLARELDDADVLQSFRNGTWRVSQLGSSARFVQP